MMKNLYKKFTIRKKVDFEEGKFLEIMKSVGKLALQTLTSNNPLLQRKEVIEIVGDAAFEYGFFAGHEDFRLFTDPSADICVTYIHKSVEQYFGSLGFIQALCEGKNIGDILATDFLKQKPFFLMDPLVLKFCLWFLSEKSFGCPDDAYEKLTSYVTGFIDRRVLNPWAVCHTYPTLNMSEAIFTKDDLVMKFCKNILVKCTHVRVLHIDRITRLDIYLDRRRPWEICREVDGLLGLMSEALLKKLTVILFKEFLHGSIRDDTLKISIKNDAKTALTLLNILLEKYKLCKRDPQLYLEIDTSECPSNLINTASKYMKQLHLAASSGRPSLSMSRTTALSKPPKFQCLWISDWQFLSVRFYESCAQ